MLPDSALWPIERLWGVHDFNLESAQYGKSFIQQMNEQFGIVDSLREWLALAQWVNYDGYRAMFRSTEQKPDGFAPVDESSGVAVDGLADVRLLFRANCRVLWVQESM